MAIIVEPQFVQMQWGTLLTNDEIDNTVEFAWTNVTTRFGFPSSYLGEWTVRHDGIPWNPCSSRGGGSSGAAMSSRRGWH
jgi:hypothetical protein